MYWSLAELNVWLDRFQADLQDKVRRDPQYTELGADIFLMLGALAAVAGRHENHVHERIGCILESLGLIAPDPTGKPCA